MADSKSSPNPTSTPNPNPTTPPSQPQSATNANANGPNVASAGAYPPRAFFRKVPFVSTKPLPPMQTFEDPKMTPERDANFLSRLTFWWLSPLLTRGYTRPLDKDDLWSLQEKRSSKHFADLLEENWKKRTQESEQRNLENQSKPDQVSWWRFGIGKKSKKVFKPSFALTMNDSVFVYFWIGGFMKLLADVGTITSPLLVRAITDFITGSYGKRENAPPLGKGVGLAVGLWLIQTVIVFLNVHSFNRGFGTGILLRGGLIHATYRRAMRISNRARTEKGLGTAKMVALISADVSRIDFCCQYFHMAWTSFVQIAICLGLLIHTLGYSALPGFAVVVALSPVQSVLTKHLFVLRKRSMKHTDARIKSISELLGGIRLIKQFAWESPYISRVLQHRRNELTFLRKRLFFRSLNISTSFATPTLAAVVSFIVYNVTGHSISEPDNAGKIFSALTFFQLLRTPLQFLPVSWNAIADAIAASQRLAIVFLAEERDEEFLKDSNLENAIQVKDANFEWDVSPPSVPGVATGNGATANSTTSNNNVVSTPISEKSKYQKFKSGLFSMDKFKKNKDNKTTPISSQINEKQVPSNDLEKKVNETADNEEQDPTEPFNLKGINLNIPRGKLVCVVGGIGSGKSSLINALAGEMRLTGGQVAFGGSVGMCAQTAWILSASVRDNILFGRPYDHERYQNVISQCCLLPDFEMLPQGDSTIVGEKGISLSGGQRQRLNIARSVYHDTDIILFDDCFSALDAHVGADIFKNVMMGSLKGKTRVLATHALHLLPSADYIITLSNGIIAEEGTYHSLMRQKGAFASFVDTYGGTMGAEEKLRIVEEEDGIGPKEGDDDLTSESDQNDENDEEKKDAAEKEEKERILEEEKLPKPFITAPQANGKAIMQQEERTTGSVTIKTYAQYFGAANLAVLFPLFILSILGFQGATVVSPLWLLWWQETKYDLTQGTYMGGYAALGVTQALGLFCMGLCFAFFTFASSLAIHQRVLKRVVFAPVSFFDTTPLGRITHRFSKDVDVVDNVIGDAIRTFLGTVIQVIGTVILIAILTPYFLIAIGILIFAYVWTGMYYRASSRELRRLDAVLRSNMYEHFSESLSGLSTIRAYGEVPTFQKENCRRMDNENRAYWLSMSCQRWLSIRLDFFGALLVLAVGLLAVFTRFTLSPGETGVALSYILTAQTTFSWMIRQSAEIENNMNAVERLLHYANEVPQEPRHHIKEVDEGLERNWPARGEIKFEKVVASHREGLPAVLKGIDLDIKGGEHVAVCGRTGAGKSTMVTTLLRMMELTSGRIMIDGVDISTLGLQALRSKISVIPQDALLFSGTMRHNLDPLGEHEDVVLWDAMRRVHLIGSSADNFASSEIEEGDSDGVNLPPSRASSFTQVDTLVGSGFLKKPDQEVNEEGNSGSSRLTLDTMIEEEGSNLSVGQRSLVSMARALVRQSQIVILDEATASVDYSTDQRIQHTLSIEMESRTVLTVAHRIATVLSSDRVCVMDQGEIIELGSPLELFEMENGTFRSMCLESGIEKAEIEEAKKKETRERAALKNKKT